MKIKDYIKEINSNKKIMCILWAVCLILFILFFCRFVKYYDVVADYNLGVKMLKTGDYDTAESMFTVAIWDKHTKRQECRIRINHALSIVKPITPDSVNEDNLEEVIGRLNEAIDILTENDCAHKNDSNGHSRKAQRLKEEIEEYIEKLQEENKSDKSDESTDSDKQSNNNDDKKTEEDERKQEEARRAKEKEDKIRELMDEDSKKGMTERTLDLDLYDDYQGYRSYNYDDKCW